MLSCKQASRLLSQSLDRRLSWRERSALRLHLAICDFCRRFGKQLLILRDTVRKSVAAIEQDESLQLSQQVRERITEAMSQAGK